MRPLLWLMIATRVTSLFWLIIYGCEWKSILILKQHRTILSWWDIPQLSHMLPENWSCTTTILNLVWSFRRLMTLSRFSIPKINLITSRSFPSPGKLIQESQLISVWIWETMQSQDTPLWKSKIELLHFTIKLVIFELYTRISSLSGLKIRFYQTRMVFTVSSQIRLSTQEPSIWKTLINKLVMFH